MSAKRANQPRDKGTNSTTENQVGFRLLSPAVMEELTRRSKSAGKSINLFARDLVIEALAQGTAEEEHTARVEEMKDQLQELAAQLRRIRGDIASSTRVLLISKGGEDPDKATQWVRDHLMT